MINICRKSNYCPQSDRIPYHIAWAIRKIKAREPISVSRPEILQGIIDGLPDDCMYQFIVNHERGKDAYTAKEIRALFAQGDPWETFYPSQEAAE